MPIRVEHDQRPQPSIVKIRELLDVWRPPFWDCTPDLPKRDVVARKRAATGGLRNRPERVPASSIQPFLRRRLRPESAQRNRAAGLVANLAEPVPGDPPGVALKVSCSQRAPSLADRVEKQWERARCVPQPL